MLVIFTDTDTDLTPEKAKEFGYHLISMPYSYDGKTIYPYEDFEVFESKKFYDMLRAGTIPTTSAISKEKYIDYFEPFFKNGDDIMYVHLSEAMTMTIENMRAAVKELQEKYPERKFYAVDTKGITIESLSIVYEIGDLYKAGKTAEEIIEWAKEEIDRFSVYFFADDLKFFKRSGRVSGFSAAMGTLIGVRPIIYINREGKMVSIGKERGKKNALNRLMQYLEEKGDDVKSHRILIAHSDAEEDANELAARVREKYGDDCRIEIVVANPTAGSHCGPNCLGISFHSVKRD
jgi:DegV family protein with EDD domain